MISSTFVFDAFGKDSFMHSFGRSSLQWSRASSFTRFPVFTQRRTTSVGSSGRVISSSQLPLSTWQHTTLTTEGRPYPLVGFEHTISAGKRPQNYNLDVTATGSGMQLLEERKTFVAVSKIFVSCGHSHQKAKRAKPEETSDTAMIFFQQEVAREKQNFKFCVPQFYRLKHN